MGDGFQSALAPKDERYFPSCYERPSTGIVSIRSRPEGREIPYVVDVL